MDRTPRLLLVEDDAVIGEATKLNLERHGYQVTWRRDGLAGWQAYLQARGIHPTTGENPDPGTPVPDDPVPDDPVPDDLVPYDVVLSDVMLPELDGISLCRRVRADSGTPFVIISARTDSLDVVTGLEAGADDYLTKPFDPQVLLARLRSVARRTEATTPSTRTSEPASPAQFERFGDLTFDRQALELRRGQQVLTLTPTEMRLFLELADQPGTVLSRGALLSRVWDYPDWADDDHVVNVHVQRLRTKIGSDAIETVRGFGYKLRR